MVCSHKKTAGGRPVAMGLLDLVCISVNIVVVILYYSFFRNLLLGASEQKVHEIFLCYFLQMHVNLQLS